MPDIRAKSRVRISAWLRHWGPLLPLLGATTIVMLGFGAVIPVLPLFVQSKGIDATTLGVIVAGWAIGRFISEPFFGWWADSHSRKPQMVASLLLVGITALLMLVFTSAAALFTLRFIAGLASGMFGPAARGSLVDATDKGSRGQAFGYFSAFQMGGFVLGPAIGAFGSSIFGGFAFPFLFMGVLGFVSAGFLWRFQKADPHVVDPLHRQEPVDSALAKTGIHATAAAESRFVAAAERSPPSQAPISAVFNRTIMAAVIIGFGLQLTFGIYDVVWPLYLIDLGASIEWVGLTFMLIGIPSIDLRAADGSVGRPLRLDALRHRRLSGHDRCRYGLRGRLGAAVALGRGHLRGRVLRAARDSALRHGREWLAPGPHLAGAGHLRLRRDHGHHRLGDGFRRSVGGRQDAALLVLRVRRGRHLRPGHAGVFGLGRAFPARFAGARR